MKKIIKIVFIFACLAGQLWILSRYLEGISIHNGFGAAVAVGLMVLGLAVILGAIGVKQALTVADGGDDQGAPN
jgi:hypothetical protein